MHDFLKEQNENSNMCSLLRALEQYYFQIGLSIKVSWYPHSTSSLHDYFLNVQRAHWHHVVRPSRYRPRCWVDPHQYGQACRDEWRPCAEEEHSNSDANTLTTHIVAHENPKENACLKKNQHHVLALYFDSSKGSSKPSTRKRVKNKCMKWLHLIAIEVTQVAAAFISP